jgi:polyphosphate kinase
MKKDEVIAKFMKSVAAYNKAIDETAKIRVRANEAEFVLADKVASIYREKDGKELGSNAETRNANLALMTETEQALVRELSNNLELARARELKCRNEVDQMKYIIRALEAQGEV